MSTSSTPFLQAASSVVAAAQTRESVREAARKRLLSDILGRVTHKRNLNGAAAGDLSQMPKLILVADERSTRVLSSVLKSYELTEEGVALPESLMRSRQPFRELEAVYLVEPTMLHADAIYKDFISNKRRTYFTGHVFFTREPPPEVVNALRDLSRLDAEDEKKRQARIAKRLSEYSKTAKEIEESIPPIVPRISSMFVANVDFLATEDHLFHLDLPKAMIQLFGPVDEQAQLCRARMVDGLASLCSTLHEYPFIRYREGSRLCETVARALEDRHETMLRDDSKFWFHGDEAHGGQGNRATVLILDRRFDLAAPLLHEFSYQALVFDLLRSRDSMVQYGEAPNEIALLNENDDVWVQTRQLHISTVIERLAAHIRAFQTTDAGRLQQASANGEQDQVTLEQMANVVNELPLYKEVMSKHAMHLALCQACMDRVNKRDLIPLSRFEQTMVTGVEAEGETASDLRLLNDLANLMRRQELEPNDKVRLAALHAVTLGQVKPDIIEKFLNDAQPPLSENARFAFLGLVSLGVEIVGNATARDMGTGNRLSNWMSSSRLMRGGGGNTFKSPYREPTFIEKNKKAAKATNLKMSRYAPLVKTPAELLTQSHLEPDDYPFVRPPPPGTGFGGAPIDSMDTGSSSKYAAHRVYSVERSLSVRKHFTSVTEEAHSEMGNRTVAQLAAEFSRGAKTKKDYQGGRFIIFIAGGVSYSEVRALGEVMRASNREVIVGSTHMITPGQYIQDLERLGDDEQARKYLAEQEDLAKEALEFYHEDANNNNNVLGGNGTVMTSAGAIKTGGGALDGFGQAVTQAPDGAPEGEGGAAAASGKPTEPVERKTSLDLFIKKLHKVPGLGMLARWLDADDVDIHANVDDDELEDEDVNFLRDLGIHAPSRIRFPWKFASCTRGGNAVPAQAMKPTTPGPEAVGN